MHLGKLSAAVLLPQTEGSAECRCVLKVRSHLCLYLHTATLRPATAASNQIDHR